MSKHPLDHDRTPSSKRAEVYTQPARAEGPHPATKALHQRPRGLSDQRMTRFTRIEREQA